jgi:hypothetical protein
MPACMYLCVFKPVHTSLCVYMCVPVCSVVSMSLYVSLCMYYMNTCMYCVYTSDMRSIRACAYVPVCGILVQWSLCVYSLRKSIKFKCLL